MIKVYFKDNEEYGAEDFNTVISTLMSCGVVLPLADGENITPEDFNSLAAQAAEGGVIWDNSGLKVSCTDGIYHVAPGKAIMPDGAIVYSDEDVTIEANEGLAGFIYLSKDSVSFEYGFCFSETEIADGVKLAEVDSDRILYDRRVFAATKLNVPCGNVYRDYQLSGSVRCAAGEDNTYTEITYFQTVDFGMPVNYVRFNGGTITGSESSHISKTVIIGEELPGGCLNFNYDNLASTKALFFVRGEGTAIDIYARSYRGYYTVNCDISLTFM